MARLSGLQKEVLKLYRNCIRAAHTKPTENREHWVQYIRDEFHKYQNVPKKQFSVVEHLLRLGHKRYELYNSPHIKDIH